jgi:ATP-dependent phosphofructokinase / diphosphate-dependent phosphofructokinase
MKNANACICFSGGPTAVLNTIASSVYQEVKRTGAYDQLLVGKNGILGVINEQFYDLNRASDAFHKNLPYTPATAFGSCRYKLGDINKHADEYKKIIDTFSRHNIKTFFYNGGNDSQDTTHKLWQMSQQMNYPLNCIGIPKTIDNDLPGTDCCPGFGSVAKYIATSTMEAFIDLKAMCATSTKVFILEVMGRHAGWIAASSGLAQRSPGQGPHIILFPEVPFEQSKFLDRVKATVAKYGCCCIVTSEGVRDAKGSFLTENQTTDAFGHAQLGGVAALLANLVKEELGYKTHYAISDYLQRAARHLASACDHQQAVALGKAAVQYAQANQSGIMLTIDRLSDTPYSWKVGSMPLGQVANKERHLPTDYISNDGFYITQACRDYLLPLIQGEAYPEYHQGLPDYAHIDPELEDAMLLKVNHEAES